MFEDQAGVIENTDEERFSFCIKIYFVKELNFHCCIYELIVHVLQNTDSFFFFFDSLSNTHTHLSCLHLSKRVKKEARVASKEG